MIEIKSKDSNQNFSDEFINHSFSDKFIKSIEKHIKSVFGVKPLNPPSVVDKIKSLLFPKYDGNKTKEFLKKLDVFSDISEIANVFYAKEKKSNISIKSKINENNTFETVANLCFPNVYGSGESINFECLPLKGFQLLLKKPIITEKSLSFLKLKVFEEIKKLNDKKYNSRGICVSQNTDSLSVGLKISNDKKSNILSLKSFYSSFLNYHGKNYNLSINSGLNGLSPFLKLTSGLKTKFYWKSFYLKSDLQCGIIKGKCHPSERFSLGGNTIGYKEGSIGVKEGGRSFFEVNNEVGMKFGNLNLFVRKGLAFNSNRNKFSGILEEVKGAMFSVKENVGLGVGVGFSYLFGGVNVGVAYTLKGGDNKYVLIFDAEM